MGLRKLVGSFFGNFLDKIFGRDKKASYYERYDPNHILDLVDELLKKNKEDIKELMEEEKDKKGSVPLAILLAYSIKNGDLTLSISKAIEIKETSSSLGKNFERYVDIIPKTEYGKKVWDLFISHCATWGYPDDYIKKLTHILIKHSDIEKIFERYQKPQQTQTPHVKIEETKQQEESKYTSSQSIPQSTEAEVKVVDIRKKEDTGYQKPQQTQTSSQQINAELENIYSFCINKLSTTLFQKFSYQLEEVKKLFDDLSTIVSRGEIGTTSYKGSFVYRTDRASEIIRKLNETLPEDVKKDFFERLWYIMRRDVKSLETFSDLRKDVENVIYRKLQERIEDISKSFIKYVFEGKISPTSRGVARSSYGEEAKKIESIFQEVYEAFRISEGEKAYSSLREIVSKLREYKERSSEKNYNLKTILLIVFSFSFFLIFLNYLNVHGFFIKTNVNFSILLFTLLFLIFLFFVSINLKRIYIK